MALNPIVFTEKVVRSFLRYQLTAYPFADEGLHGQMRRLLSLDETRQSPLLKGPYISLSRPFRQGASVEELVRDGVFHPHMRQRIPPEINHVYGHQEEAIRAIRSGRTTLVSTGTGSGKTECFLYPIVSKCLELRNEGTLGGGVIEVTEVDNHGAVSNLKVHNKSPRMVLILDGEELVGAKQNRIVNTTILIAGDATVVIPVSCVEQGRWTYNTPKFYSQERIMPSRMRAMKAEQVQRSVRATGEFQADQSAIWQDISERAARRNAMSPSTAMAGIYEKDLPSLQEYLRHFTLVGSQVGAVFLINGKVVGVDAFGKPETFSKTFKKLVESYAMDASDWLEEEREDKPSKSEVTRFT